MGKVIENRYDFVLLFDVKDGNPNGDPDAGNLPRVDPEDGKGLVTDVCLKRKVRNYVLLAKEGAEGYDIYVKEKAVLGDAHFAAFKKLNIPTGDESRKPIPKEMQDEIGRINLPEGLSVRENDDDNSELVVAADADKKAIKEWMKEEKIDGELKTFFNRAMKDANPRRPTGEETERGKLQMCKAYYDIRTFGAVMSLKSAPNCGQVRGPVQLTFARSIDRVVQLEHRITRMAVATAAEAEKQSGDNHTMGLKFTLPYGLYRCHGFVSAPLAAQTGFTEDDLNLFWEALMNMFEHDRSAARGEMTTRKLVIFKHEGKMGNAPASSLFDRVQVKRRDEKNPPRAYTDYDVAVNDKEMPEGVTLILKL